MGRRVKLNNSLGVIFELVNNELREAEVTPIENIFEDLEYGEILIKVVKGEIASIEVRRKYQPYDLTDES